MVNNTLKKQKSKESRFDKENSLGNLVGGFLGIAVGLSILSKTLDSANESFGKSDKEKREDLEKEIKERGLEVVLAERLEEMKCD